MRKSISMHVEKFIHVSLASKSIFTWRRHHHESSSRVWTILEEEAFSIYYRASTSMNYHKNAFNKIVIDLPNLDEVAKDTSKVVMMLCLAWLVWAPNDYFDSRDG